MPILNKPDMNYGVWAEGGNIEIPSSEKVDEGWVVEKPLNETMNWLQNRQDRMLQYINERGIPEWDSRTQYPLDAFVARSGVIYKAISPNTDNDPTLHTTIWNIAFVSYSDFVDYAEKIDSIENDEGYLSLYVSKSKPVMTGAARGISYNDSEIKAGLGFEQGVAKIHKDLKVVAEFSGGTNPKDVVTHEQLALALQTFKIGDIYTTTVDENPTSRLGYGSWERFAKGRTLVGISDDLTIAIPEWAKFNGREYGSYTHTLLESELPKHNHDFPADDQLIHAFDMSRSVGFQRSGYDAVSSLSSSYTSGWAETSVEGNNQPHNNVQPSIVVYFWKRVS